VSSGPRLPRGGLRDATTGEGRAVSSGPRLPRGGLRDAAASRRPAGRALRGRRARLDPGHQPGLPRRARARGTGTRGAGRRRRIVHGHALSRLRPARCGRPRSPALPPDRPRRERAPARAPASLRRALPAPTSSSSSPPPHRSSARSCSTCSSERSAPSSPRCGRTSTTHRPSRPRGLERSGSAPAGRRRPSRPACPSAPQDDRRAARASARKVATDGVGSQRPECGLNAHAVLLCGPLTFNTRQPAPRTAARPSRSAQPPKKPSAEKARLTRRSPSRTCTDGEVHRCARSRASRARDRCAAAQLAVAPLLRSACRAPAAGV
jgi:hypothetical protein